MTVSAGDSHPYCIWNARYRVVLPILDADGDLVTGATAPDSELSQDQGAFADATNEITEIATASGMYYLDLISTETDCKCVAIIVKTTSAGAKTTPIVLYPKRLPVIRTGTAQAGAATTITLDASASAADDFYVGCIVNITNNSPANALGQARRIIDYVGSTKVATVESAWGTNPSSASTFEILLTEEACSSTAIAGTAMNDPATAGIQDVNVQSIATGAITAGSIAADAIAAAKIATGAITAAKFAAGAIDAAAIAADAITAAKIADGAIDAATFAAGAINAAAIAADAITDAKVAPDVTIASVTGAVGSVTGAVGSVTGAVGSVTGAVGSVTGAVGSVTGNVGGNVTGSVGSIAAGGIATTSFAAGAIDNAAFNVTETLTANPAAGGITAASFAAGAIDAAAIATDAIGSSELAAAAVTKIADAVLRAALTESYAADGAAPTLTQAVFAVQQFLQEKAVSSTTLTVKKLDGVTTAQTFTLDSATAPTSITRAT